MKISISEFQRLRRAGRMGAISRMAKYGNPGTLAGRVKGGKNAIKSQIASIGISPFVARRTETPKYCNELAEFVGIILGDGHIGANQISISLNMKADKDYSSYVAMLIQNLFKFKPTINVMEDRGVIIILLSRKNLVSYLKSIGMRVGNKVHQQVDVPDWIKQNWNYSKMCLRGLIDTDGCMYLDKHLISNRLYEHLGLNFTNRSIPLLDFVKSVWIRLGYNPTKNGRFSIYVRKGNDIISYMKSVGSSSSKIVNIFENYIVRHGRVPKRS